MKKKFTWWNEKIGIYTFLLVMVSCAQYMPQSVRSPKRMFSPIWIKNLDSTYESGNLPIALHSPLIHEGILYSGNDRGKMEAYELENGRLIWSFDDHSTYHGGIVPYKDQIIYGTVEGRVVSRHGILGKVKYEVDLGASVETKGVIENGRIFFHLRNHQVFCLDVETGKILWAYKRSVSDLTTVQRASMPIVFNGKVFVGFADGHIVGLSLEEGVVLFETKLSTGAKFVDVDNQAFVFDEKIYISPVGGNLNVLDPNTGKSIRVSEFSVSRGPKVLSNGHLLFGTPSGEIILTDKNLSVLKSLKVSNKAESVTSMVPYKGKFAISTSGGKISLVDLQSFNVLETYSLGHAYSGVFGEMHSTGDHLALLTSRNRLIVFH